MQHRQEDSHAVYVRSKIDASDAKHRQEHGHAVYVGGKKATILDKLGQEVGHNVQVSQLSKERTDARSKGEYWQHRTVEVTENGFFM